MGVLWLSTLREETNAEFICRTTNYIYDDLIAAKLTNELK